jgi:hypothetical protein
MKPEISEFSYGYALTDELIHWHGTALTAAPIFPSLYQEGQPGGGYDVMLQRPGVPLFLQFKLADCMVRNTASEARDGHFLAPFYRMYIRPIRHSEQYNMLLALEADGNEVYYSSPAFHTPEELNDAYLNHHVRDRSLWVRPSWIGQLQDTRDHHVAFQIPGTPFFCSKARKLEARGDFEEFTTQMQKVYQQRGRTALSKESLARLSATMGQILVKRRDVSQEAKERIRITLAQRHPLDSIAFYAHILFDCQFFIVSEKR